jgi:hypothetical protein
MSTVYVDDDAVSDFTDDNGETVIVADVAPTAPRVFVVHFV